MKKAAWILLAIFCVTSTTVYAAGDAPSSEKTGAQLIGSVMKRGALNLLTCPGELVRTGEVEKESHPKAWVVTYIPRVFTNLVIRVASSVNDVGVLPWYVWATKDPRPITSFFDLPDYAIQ